MDGALLATKTVQTKPSGLVYFDPYSEEELRLTLPEGDHVFRAGFIGDEFVKTLPNEAAYDRRKNKFLDSIVFVGPFAPRRRQGEPPQNPHVQPGVGPRVRRADRHRPRAPRLPSSADARELNALMRFVDLGARECATRAQSAEQGVQLAIQAMLVSPHFLFRIERDPDPRDPALVHKVSPFELASRLSYFLWSSMPDDELLSARGVGTAARCAGAGGAGRSHAGRPARVRASPPTSPASGSRRATSMSSSRIPTCSRSGRRSCATR